MKQTIFDRLITVISSKLKILEDLGTQITNDIIDKKINALVNEYEDNSSLKITSSDVDRLKFHVGCVFNVRVGEAAISLRNPELPRWFDSKKSEFDWHHWKAYRNMLESQGRSGPVIDANEEVINDVLDFSGDPRTPGSWSRKGLVMGLSLIHI